MHALCEAAGAPPELVQAHADAVDAGGAVRMRLTGLALVRSLPALKTGLPCAE